MAANPSSSTRGARPAPRTSGRGSRIFAIALTGIGVLAIAACAVLLSYNGIYQIARQGGVDQWYAHMYPGAFTLLLLIAFWTSYLLRDAPRFRRLGVDALILGLILAAAFASALQPLGYYLLPEAAVVVTAVAPWVALLIAFRLWLWVVSHLRGERPVLPRRPRSARPAVEARPADTAPLSAEPAPGPAQPEEPKVEPPQEREEAAPSSSTLLWSRKHNQRSGEGSSVRVLEREEAEAHTVDGDLRPAGTSAPESRAAAPEKPEDPRPGDGEDIVPFPEPEPEPAREARSEAAEAEEYHSEPAREELPKRVPQPETNPIKKAAAPVMEDASAAEEGAAEGLGTASGQHEEGFVHDLPPGDPTNDEADIPAGEGTPGAFSGSEHETDPRLGKRPVALRPRRPPMAGFPADPPSRRVRSEPTPPEGADE